MQGHQENSGVAATQGDKIQNPRHHEAAGDKSDSEMEQVDVLEVPKRRGWKKMTGIGRRGKRRQRGNPGSRRGPRNGIVGRSKRRSESTKSERRRRTSLLRQHM